MQQIYHSNARTNLNIHIHLKNNSGNNSILASKIDISKQTVSKWKNRDALRDASRKPLNIKYALALLENIFSSKLKICIVGFY